MRIVQMNLFGIIRCPWRCLFLVCNCSATGYQLNIICLIAILYLLRLHYVRRLAARPKWHHIFPALRHFWFFVAAGPVLVRCYMSWSSQSSCSFPTVHSLLRCFKSSLILPPASLAFVRLVSLEWKK